MKCTCVSVFAGMALFSAATVIPMAPAQAYGGYSTYNQYQRYTSAPIYSPYAQVNARYQSFRPNTQIYSRYQVYSRGARAAYRQASTYRRAVLAPHRAARGGGGGLATFYDPGPRGAGFTAAHLSLPMGTRVLVTNLSNRRSVVVRIADRGPEAWTGRILDLSRVAAASLGMIQSGVAPVSYRVVN